MTPSALLGAAADILGGALQRLVSENKLRHKNALMEALNGINLEVKAPIDSQQRFARLLELLDLKDAVVTIDAMGRQRDRRTFGRSRRPAADGIGDADGVRRRELVMHQQFTDQPDLKIEFRHPPDLAGFQRLPTSQPCKNENVPPPQKSHCRWPRR